MKKFLIHFISNLNVFFVNKFLQLPCYIVKVDICILKILFYLIEITFDSIKLNDIILTRERE